MGFSLQAALVALLQTSRLQAHNYQSELVSANLLSTNRKMLRLSFLIFHKRPKTTTEFIHPVCRRSSFLTEEGGGDGGGPKSYNRENSLVLYKSFNTLWSTQTSHPFKNWYLQRRHFRYHPSILFGRTTWPGCGTSRRAPASSPPSARASSAGSSSSAITAGRPSTGTPPLL
jgi:hypothetical protein